MKIGDDPKARAQLGPPPDNCPTCGGPKKPEFPLCYACSQKRPDSADRSGARPREGGAPPPSLAANLVFSSFYGENGKLHKTLFFDAPQQAAEAFQRARSPDLTKTAFRMLYQGFQSFAGPLRDRRMDFDTAQERFGVFYGERVARQVQRGYLPPLVRELIDRHRDLILSSREEMLGFFRYLTNILCYFGDKEEGRRS